MPTENRKKRSLYKTLSYSLEGDTEAYFFQVIRDLFENNDQPQNIRSVTEQRGGGPDSLLSQILDVSVFSPDCSFVWIDEDKDLSKESRKKLARRWGIKAGKETEDFFNTPLSKLQKEWNKNKKSPILIISHPICFEGWFLQNFSSESLPEELKKLDKTCRKQQGEGLKALFRSHTGAEKVAEYEDFFRRSFSKEFLSEKRKNIPELNLLISLVEL